MRNISHWSKVLLYLEALRVVPSGTLPTDSAAPRLRERSRTLREAATRLHGGNPQDRAVSPLARLYHWSLVICPLFFDRYFFDGTEQPDLSVESIQNLKSNDQ
jgi:hypothetical protein